MRAVKVTLLALILIDPSCAPKPATPGSTPDAFTGAAKAADDIALSISLLRETEHNLEVQKIITPQEGLRVISGLTVLHDADVGFVSDIRAVRAGAGTTATLLVPSLQRLKKAVSDLNTAGVLGIKSESARATFQTALGTINLSLGVIQTVLEAAK